MKVSASACGSTTTASNRSVANNRLTRINKAINPPSHSAQARQVRTDSRCRIVTEYTRGPAASESALPEERHGLSANVTLVPLAQVHGNNPFNLHASATRPIAIVYAAVR